MICKELRQNLSQDRNGISPLQDITMTPPE